MAIFKFLEIGRCRQSMRSYRLERTRKPVSSYLAVGILSPSGIQREILGHFLITGLCRFRPPT